MDSVGFEPTVALYFVNAQSLRTDRLSYSNAFLPLGRVFLSATNPYLTARNQKPNSPSCKTPSRFTLFCVTILPMTGLNRSAAGVLVLHHYRPRNAPLHHFWQSPILCLQGLCRSVCFTTLLLTQPLIVFNVVAPQNPTQALTLAVTRLSTVNWVDYKEGLQ